MDIDQFMEKYEAYARSIGLVILGMNSLEANIYYILYVMGEAKPHDEAKYLAEKLKMLDAVAKKQEPKIRARLEKIVKKSRAFLDDRNNFAHAHLWVDAETSVFRRSYVRRKDKKLVTDERAPAEIEAFNDDIREVSWDAREAGMDLGGIKRWEEYLDSLGPDATYVKAHKPT